MRSLETAAVGSDFRRWITTAGLVLVAGFLAWSGRIVLDRLMAEWPQYGAQIDYFGQGVVAVVVLFVVLIPMFKMYGVINPQKKR